MRISLTQTVVLVYTVMVLTVARAFAETPYAVHGGYPHAIEADFTRTTTISDSHSAEPRMEVVEGTVFYARGGRTVIRIDRPIQQWMLVTGSEMVLYYPDASWAVEMRADTPIDIPVVQSLLLWFNPSDTLSAAGYTRADEKTLTTRWLPSQRLSQTIADVLVTVDAKARPVRIASRSAELVLARENLYLSFKDEGWGRVLPTVIQTLTARPSGGMETEEVVFTRIELDLPLPTEIVNFSIPDGVEVSPHAQ
jgi:outer membrane lipoprotein-sorting protein